MGDFDVKGTLDPLGVSHTTDQERAQQDASAAQAEAARAQAAIAKALFTETAPLRAATFGELDALLRGGSSPNLLTPLREGLELDFQGARERVLSSSGARGGQLTSSLVALEGDRARAIGQQRQRAFELALGAGTNAVGPALAGFGAAGSAFGQQAALAAQQGQAKQQGLGQAAAIGAKLAFA